MSAPPRAACFGLVMHPCGAWRQLCPAMRIFCGVPLRGANLGWQERGA